MSPSQTDYDQGGTSRQWIRTFMGPTIGWVDLPGTNPFDITAAGTYTLQPDTTLVRVNVNGTVTINLPTALDPTVPAVGIAGPYAKSTLTIIDIGGFAAANPITLNPASGAENIMGLASISISTNYGGFTLKPSNAQKGWTSGGT
jgi:hypothetical protein